MLVVWRNLRFFFFSSFDLCNCFVFFIFLVSYQQQQRPKNKQDLIVSNPNIDMAILREFESEEYPLLLESPSGWPVPVVGVGAWGRNIGRANLEFDIFGRMNNMTGDLVRLDSSYPMDPDVQARFFFFFFFVVVVVI